MPVNMLKTEADLRHAVIDRLIAASLSNGKPSLEATIERWRRMSIPATDAAKTEIKAS
ncbi:hypothetical protein GCM10010909_02580 [Acidocella aquatica]|uniref:Uncharacterized protein n=1 Tax=Acidocella aquatica TaxID=1922313 RepID=A0ABQ6A2V8_9PROT|nr:hypothetical protein [Acidocella aquatica]GLR65580.1 hypothetical protein GCM10010909_02580 [Acidocella aquatica]